MLMKTRVGVEREGWSGMRVGGAGLERETGDGRRETGDGRREIWWETGDGASRGDGSWELEGGGQVVVG